MLNYILVLRNRGDRCHRRRPFWLRHLVDVRYVSIKFTTSGSPINTGEVLARMPTNAISTKALLIAKGRGQTSRVVLPPQWPVAPGLQLLSRVTFLISLAVRKRLWWDRSSGKLSMSQLPVLHMIRISNLSWTIGRTARRKEKPYFLFHTIWVRMGR